MRFFFSGGLLLLSLCLHGQPISFEFSLGQAWPVSGYNIQYAEGLSAKSTALSLGAGVHGNINYLYSISDRFSILLAGQYSKLERVIRQSRFDMAGNSEPIFTATDVKNEISSLGLHAVIGVRHFPMGREGLYPWIQVSGGAGYSRVEKTTDISNSQGSAVYDWKYNFAGSPLFQFTLGGNWELGHSMGVSLQLRYRWSSVMLEDYSSNTSLIQINSNQNLPYSARPETPFPASSIVLLGGFRVQMPWLN